jgi:FKBP-type peptidyl-prolyl cis-trans isomerase
MNFSNMPVSSLKVAMTTSLLAVSIAACAAKLDTQKKKVSYAIGQQIGETIKQQGLEVDLDVLKKSIQDVMAGKKSELSMEDMRTAMMQAQKDTQEKQAKMGEENLKKGQEFLEANKKKEGFITTETGLQYKITKEGTGATPSDQDTVVCHYKGTLTDGTEFDSSYSRNQPAEFPVMGVIPGWTEALKTMKVGEKRELVIPANLAYGPSPRPGIPANSVLKFDIELIEIKKAPATPAAPAKKGAAKGAK